jgi:hypothetical protein
MATVTPDEALERWHAAERRLQVVRTGPERVRARFEADHWHELYKAAVKEAHEERVREESPLRTR